MRSLNNKKKGGGESTRKKKKEKISNGGERWLNERLKKGTGPNREENWGVLDVGGGKVRGKKP